MLVLEMQRLGLEPCPHGNLYMDFTSVGTTSVGTTSVGTTSVGTTSMENNCTNDDDVANENEIETKFKNGKD